MSKARKRRKGGMAYESAIIDPETGESLSGGDNSPEACAQRLRMARALKALERGDKATFHRLAGGEEP